MSAKHDDYFQKLEEKLSQISDDAREQMLEEIKETIKQREELEKHGCDWNGNPVLPPGQYNLGPNRGELIEHNCSACGARIEVVYLRHVTYINPTNDLYPVTNWSISKYRCSKCKLLFDL